MARLWLCTLFALGGCLFVGDVNQRPSVQLDVTQASATIGVPISFTATLYDDQPLPTLDVEVFDDAGDPASGCAYVYANPNPPDASPQTFTVTFWQTGMYSVKVKPRDALGAYGSSAATLVDIEAAGPSFADPSTAIAPENAGVACGALYTSGAPIPIRLNGAVNDPETGSLQTAPMKDPVSKQACPTPPSLLFVWSLTTLPNDSSATLGPVAPGTETCPTEPTTKLTTIVTAANVDLVCLYIDGNLPTTSPSMYGITLTAQEGDQKTSSDVLLVDAIGSAPACLDGVYPVVGSYVLAADDVTVFQAVGVDELSTSVAGLEFLWSIEGPNDTSYTTLGAPATAAEGGDRFSFDPTTLGYAVGDDVHLRVEVSDPTQTAPACAATDDVCAAASCVAAPATTCPRRATWDIEVR